MDSIIIFSIHFINILATSIYWIVIASVLLSWFSAGNTPVGQWITRIVSPLCYPFRWARIGMFDLSPIALIILLQLIQRYLIEFLVQKIS